MKINSHTCNDCGVVWSYGHICPVFAGRRRKILIIQLVTVSVIAVASMIASKKIEEKMVERHPEWDDSIK